MNQNLRNPHLEGETFFWEAGSTGILLVHGFTATTAEVRLLAQALHKDGYTLSGPLLPGHGTHVEEMNRCRWQDWVEAVEGAYRELASRCEKVVVGGESMGGLLALYLASHHPEAAAVLTYAPALKTTTWRKRILAGLFSRWVAVQLRGKEPPTAADTHWQGYAELPVAAGVQLFRFQREVRKCLPAIHQPLLIVQGRHDKTVHPEVPALLSRRVSSSLVEVHWMENSTHCLILDAEQEQVAQITNRFLARVLHS